MGVLIYEQKENIRAKIAKSLIKNGYNIDEVTDSGRIHEKLKFGKYKVLLVDYNSEENFLNRLISQIKTDPEAGNPHIIAHTHRNEQSFVKNMIVSGVSGVILKPFDEDNFSRLFSQFMQKVDTVSEKRRYTRVTPKVEDEAQITYVDRINNKFKANILNISINGIAFYFQNEKPKEDMRKQDDFSNILVTVKGRSIKTDIKVVNRNGDYFGAQMEVKSERDKELIADYIYQRFLEISSFREGGDSAGND